METSKKPLSIRVIYWLTQVVFWLYVLVVIGFTIMLVAFWSGLPLDELQLHVGLPVKFDVQETGMLYYDGDGNPIQIVEAQGKIHLLNTDPQLAIPFINSMAGTIYIFAFIIWCFWQFVRNVYDGMIFETRNIRYLKFMAIGLSILWIWSVVYSYWLNWWMVKRMSFESIDFSSEVADQSEFLVVALLLWVLAHIFTKGVQLQEDQKLTI
jgi:hypothetical protein